MGTLLSIIYIIAGIALVIWGADRFTDGATSFAANKKVPPIVIGLTIVAFGTSAPELFVSAVSALRGQTGMAVGNIIGSNIFNTLLIVGLSAVVMPIMVGKNSVIKDIPFTLIASVLLVALINDGEISRIDSFILLAFLIIFLIYNFRFARKNRDTQNKPEIKHISMNKCVLLILLGLVCLIVGSNIFVIGATNVAGILGVSDAVIGLTIVAGGTSLPELATSIIAAKKGQSALAIGNVIGSNVFNILGILGITGLICPMQTSGLTIVDSIVLLASIIVLLIMSRTSYKISRKEGAILLLIFIAYMSWIVYNC